ncbi:hypothetical protein Neosp_009763 [[Neocosmospora] mangrovei]
MGDTAPSDLFTFHVTVISKESYEIRDTSNSLLANLPPPVSDLEENPSFLMDIIEHLVSFATRRQEEHFFQDVCAIDSYIRLALTQNV